MVQRRHGLSMILLMCLDMLEILFQLASAATLIDAAPSERRQSRFAHLRHAARHVWAFICRPFTFLRHSAWRGGIFALVPSAGELRYLRGAIVDLVQRFGKNTPRVMTPVQRGC